MITFGSMEVLLVTFYHPHKYFAFGEKQIAIFYRYSAHRAFYFGGSSAKTDKLRLIFDAIANHIVQHPLV